MFETLNMIFDNEEPLYASYLKKNPDVTPLQLSLELLYNNSSQELIAAGKYACVLSFLPKEILLKILEYVSYDGSILQLARTSTFFNRLTMEFMKYERLDYECNTILHHHQLQAINYMKHIERLYDTTPQETNSVSGCILKHTMGLGKTLTSLMHTLTSKKGEFPTLVVCTKTAFIEWMSELKKHFGDEKGNCRIPVLLYHKSCLELNEYRNLTAERLKEYEIVVTTYNVLVTECTERLWSERAVVRTETNRVDSYVRVHTGYEDYTVKGPSCLFHTPFQRIITDESHIFNNPKSKTFTSVMSIMARYSHCLTGTPMRNSYTDLWSLFKFMGLAPYTKKYGFHVRYKHTDFSDVSYEHYGLSKYIHSLNYANAGIVLPPRIDKDIIVEFGKTEKRAYEFFESNTKRAFTGYISKSTDFMSLLSTFVRLRQCSIAPYLVCNESKRGRSESEGYLMKSLENVMSGLSEWIRNEKGEAGIGSTKIREILNILREIPKDEKCVVFSSFTSCLDLINKAILNDSKLRRIGVCRLDGDVKTKERERDINDFKMLPDKRILLSTYKCGSEGLNLTCACHVICVEPWWTDTVEQQAVSRCLRFGQKKPVTVYRIGVKDSIETRMINLIVSKKREMIDKIFSEVDELYTSEVDTKKNPTNYELGVILGVYR